MCHVITRLKIKAWCCAWLNSWEKLDFKLYTFFELLSFYDSFIK